MLKSNTVAAFDFDNTITTCDTLYPFLCFITPSKIKIAAKSFKLLPTLVAYKLGYLDNQTAKEKLLTTFLHNQSIEALKKQGEAFAEKIIPARIKPEALQRLRWHQTQGHYCVLISAGLEIYLHPWAKQMGFDAIQGTKLNAMMGITNGKIDGKNCFGQEKVDRLIQCCGDKKNYTLYAYGDSRGDRELLALADHAYYRQIPQ